MSFPNHYRIFDVPLASEIPLPELPVLEDTGARRPQIEVVLGLPAGWDRSVFQHAVDWLGPDRQAICSVARHGDDYWFEFPGHAGFYITSAGRFHCQAQAGCDEHLMRHFLLNQAIPRYLGSNGRMVLHASAVVLPDGRTVAFVGRSGAGKSTLAASFMQAGARLLADDCLLLEPERDRVRVIGAYPGVRLRDGDVNTLFGSGEAFSAVDGYSGKRQAVMAQVPPGPDTDWQTLTALCLLAEPEAGDEEVRFEIVSGAQAMLACLNAVFSLDPGKETTTVTAFAAVGQVMAQRFPVFLLHYPRRHDALAAVHSGIARALPPLQSAISAQV